MPLHAKKKNQAHLQDGCARRQAPRRGDAAEHRDEQRRGEGGESRRRHPLTLFYFRRLCCYRVACSMSGSAPGQDSYSSDARERSWKERRNSRGGRERESCEQDDDRRGLARASPPFFLFTLSLFFFSSSLSLSAVMPATTPPPAPPPPRRGRREPRCEFQFFSFTLPRPPKELPLGENDNAHTSTSKKPKILKTKKKNAQKDSRFSQQELRRWEGRPSRAQAAAILLALGISLIPLGVACLFASASVRKI